MTVNTHPENIAGIPADRKLAGAASLLDLGVMGGVFERSLGSRGQVRDVRVSRVHYKPSRKMIVSYEVGVDARSHVAVAVVDAKSDLEAEARKASNLAYARSPAGRAPVEHPLGYEPELGALIQWLPFDISLPALSVPERELAGMLRRARIVDGSSPRELRLIGYKPLGRAVLRWGDRVLKAYADEAHFRRAIAGLRIASAVTKEGPGADLPELRLTVQAVVAGRPSGDPVELGVQAGAMLRAVHSLPTPLDLPPLWPQDQLRAAGECGTLIQTVAPQLTSRVSALLDGLEATMPGHHEMVTSHGDFEIGQILVEPRRSVLIDFDDVCVAPPAFDLGNFAAHPIGGEPGDLETALETLAALGDGYGRLPTDVSWYLASAIVERAPFPFRRYEERWPERVEAMVDVAEAALREVTLLPAIDHP